VVKVKERDDKPAEESLGSETAPSTIICSARLKDMQMVLRLNLSGYVNTKLHSKESY
jgi:hypothetical protein